MRAGVLNRQYAEVLVEDVRTGNWRLFAPDLGDDGRTYAKIVEIGRRSPEEARAGLEAMLVHVPKGSPIKLRLEAAVLVLRDLISLGWHTLVNDGYLYVRPGAPGLLSKESARRQLEFGRDDQLAEPATRKFIISLERPGRASSAYPVTNLIGLLPVWWTPR